MHLRIGDTAEYYNEILEISRNEQFDKIIIICGVHNNWHSLRKYNTNYNKVMLTFKNAIYKLMRISRKIEFYFSEPDIHVSLMRLAVNLKVHK